MLYMAVVLSISAPQSRGIATLCWARILMTLAGFFRRLTGGRLCALGLLSHVRQQDGPLAQSLQQQSRLLADRENAAGDLSQIEAEGFRSLEASAAVRLLRHNVFIPTCLEPERVISDASPRA